MLATQVFVDDRELFTPCSLGDNGAMKMTWTEVDSDKFLEPPLQLLDLTKAIQAAKPSVSVEDIKKNEEWTKVAS
jgi:vacuolar protein-sorting-associated protein 4